MLLFKLHVLLSIPINKASNEINQSIPADNNFATYC